MATARSRLLAVAALAAAAGFAVPASAAPRHHRAAHTGAAVQTGRSVAIDYDRSGRAPHGSQALVSDGPGTGFGFHRLPGPYRVGAAAARGRQRDAVHSAIVDDAVESYGYGPFYGGLVGAGGFGANGYGNRGVFSYPDGYGSPYFAGYYGEGGGADLGVLGHAY